jgi:DNA repair photolyase
VRAASEAGADYVFANALFLKPSSAAIFLPFLETNFPHLAENYRQRYQNRSFLPPSYGKRLSQFIAKLKERYKLSSRYRNERRAYATKLSQPEFDRQMEMF